MSPSQFYSTCIDTERDQLHHAQSIGCSRADQSMESAVVSAYMEDCTVHRLRLHVRVQAERVHVGDSRTARTSVHRCPYVEVVFDE